MRHTRRRMLMSGIVAIVASTTMGIGAASAAADIPCTPRALSKAFSQFGDTNDYFTVSDGTFENGIGSWTTTGLSRVTTSQEPWKVNGAAHTKSLAMTGTATATTAPACVVAGEDWVRFFYKPVNMLTVANPSAQLIVTITARSDQGTATSSVVLRNTGGTSWLVSPPIAIPNVRGERGEQYVTITFAATGGYATWLVDDVMIDPFKVR